MNYHLSPDELVSTLDTLDVPFLAGGEQSAVPPSLTPVELLTALAQAREARLRSAIIPMLLRHPEFAPHARAAATRLSGLPRVTLQCFYTAALLLQRKYVARLKRLLGAQPSLPDWFSADLGVSLSEDETTLLGELSERHAALTGLPINWAGTYEHAVERLIKRLENQARWAQQATRHPI